jgi:hypothetical protein
MIGSPPPTACTGLVANPFGSDHVIIAEMANGATQEVQIGEYVGNTEANPVTGFRILDDDVEVKIDYFRAGGSYLETHAVDVPRERSFDVDPCHQAYVVVSDPVGVAGIS